MDGIKNKDLVVGTKIQDTPVDQIKNKENPSGTKILTIGFKIENELPTENLCSRIEI
jgi:hypothetical protein